MPASGLLRYPYEAITQNTDYLQIRIFHYERSGVTGGPKPPAEGQAFDVSNYVSNKAKVLDQNGVIILPMPSNIQDSNSVSFESDSLNAFAAQGVSAVQSLMKAGGSTVSDFLTGQGVSEENILQGKPGNQAKFKDVKEGIEFFVKSKQQVQNALTTKLAIEAVNLFGANVSFNTLLARTDGKILNPNMELLFNNVTLRTFRFSFKLAPRDKNEATVVKSIIRTLKKNMAAQKAENDIFLQTPNIFKLTYRKGNQNHPFLHRFKDCALSDMNVQYTGDNVYATYSDGTPVSMILNLTFKELVPIYSDDYNETEPGEGSGTNPGEFNDGQLIYGVNQNNTSKHVEGVGF